MRKSTGSLIRWAGSKTKSASKIVPYLDFNRPYIEPFCGSATFFFQSEPANSSLNDTNSALMSFYDQVARNPTEVWTTYSELPIDEKIYYDARSEFNALPSGARKASLFLYLNHYGFNGLYRTNQSGELNTPFGSRTKIRNKMPLQELIEYSASLQTVNLHCSDFEEFLRKLAPTSSCIYMDPPYFTKDVRVFGEYGAEAFNLHDLERLYAVSVELARKGNKVVVSYRDCTEFRKLFGSSITTEIKVQRNVGGFAGRRKTDQELVAVLSE
jgi:DNA adenine methylase